MKDVVFSDYHYTILAFYEGEWRPAYDAEDLTVVSVAIMELIMNEIDKDNIIVYDNFNKREVTEANLYAE